MVQWFRRQWIVYWQLWDQQISFITSVNVYCSLVSVISSLRQPVPSHNETLKADSHIACRAHKGLECVFPTWFTQCGRVWFTLAMPRPCHALTMPFFARPRHSMAIERRPVGHLPAFGFFRLSRRVPRRLLSDAHQSQMQVASVKPNTVCHGRGKE